MSKHDTHPPCPYCGCGRSQFQSPTPTPKTSPAPTPADPPALDMGALIHTLPDVAANGLPPSAMARLEARLAKLGPAADRQAETARAIVAYERKRQLARDRRRAAKKSQVEPVEANPP